MKLVIGLGNPGQNYEMTRHNAGFLFLDFLQKEFDFEPFTPDKKMLAEISSGMLKDQKILLIKPTTFMNDSGTTVQALLQFYKLTPSDIVVIHDDLDITPRNYRVTLSSRPAGHNGVTDIIEKLGTQDFFRFRLGIGHPAEVLGACLPAELPASNRIRAGISTHDYVLQKFTPEEFATLSALFPRVKEEIVSWIHKK